MKRFWWRAYFFLMLVLTVIGIGFVPFVFESSESSWLDWVFYPLCLAQLAGLYGFVYSRPLAVPLVWRATLVATLIYEAWNMISTALEDVASPGLLAAMVGVSVSVLLLQAPMFVAIYRYGFKSGELWRGAI